MHPEHVTRLFESYYIFISLSCPYLHIAVGQQLIISGNHGINIDLESGGHSKYRVAVGDET